MTIVYVTTGPWGTGTDAQNSAAQVDGNFYDVDQRIETLNADLAEGKRIESVTYTSNSMTFHFTDGSTQVIPLPIATLEFVGEWLNSTPYIRGNMISFRGLGIYQVLVDHVTPPPPAPFDANATDGSGNPLYVLWMPLRQHPARGGRAAIPRHRQSLDGAADRQCSCLCLSRCWRCGRHQHHSVD
jgi:hypothetical protein